VFISFSTPVCSKEDALKFRSAIRDAPQRLDLGEHAGIVKSKGEADHYILAWRFLTPRKEKGFDGTEGSGDDVWKVEEGFDDDKEKGGGIGILKAMKYIIFLINLKLE
jgi:hypothetical protein